MPKHRGPKPAAQPRSLRSIAERNRGKFEDIPAYDAQAGIPATAPSAGQHYDASEEHAAHPPQNLAVRQRNAGDPNPFK